MDAPIVEMERPSSSNKFEVEVLKQLQAAVAPVADDRGSLYRLELGQHDGCHLW